MRMSLKRKALEVTEGSDRQKLEEKDGPIVILKNNYKKYFGNAIFILKLLLPYSPVNTL